MSDRIVIIQELKDTIKQFVAERDWMQYHNPKSLSMSIAIEAGELMEKFQFLTNEESFEIAKSHKDEVAHELCDVLSYVLNFANIADIDLSAYFEEKMKMNRNKYSIEEAKGAYGKYTKLLTKKK